MSSARAGAVTTSAPECAQSLVVDEVALAFSSSGLGAVTEESTSASRGRERCEGGESLGDVEEPLVREARARALPSSKCVALVRTCASREEPDDYVMTARCFMIAS